MLPLLRMRWSDIRRSATFRLTTLLGCVFLVAVVALLSLTYVLTEKELVARNDQVVYKEARRLAAVPRGRMTAAVDAAIANNASGLNYFGLIGSNGQVLAGNMPQVPQLLPGEPFEIPAGAGVPVPLRVYVLPLADGCRLVVARDNTTLADLRDRVLAITVGSGLLVAVSAAVVGFWLSLGMLKRIGRMTDTAQHIARGELGQRMPVAGRHDELDLIATTVNAMMEEIERLLQQVKGATDAIAHDLRTPLAHLRHRLQGLSEREETASPIVERAVEELDLVLSRFTALLRISELEVAGRRAGFGLLDPMAVVAEVCELYEPLAEERGIRLTLSGDFGQVVEGDRLLLIEAIGNLVENAIKFIARGGTVQLQVAATGERVAIEVRDNGPGIAEAERALVLGRFHRGAGGRHAPGSGLGLSLVAAIAHLHGFALSLGDAAPGLVVRIIAPRAGEGA